MRLSISTRLIVGFLIVVVCLGLAGLFALRGLYRTHVLYETALDAYTDQALIGLQLKGLLLDEVRAQKNYLLRGDIEYLELARTRSHQASEAQARLLRSMAEGQEQEAIERAVTAVDDLRATFEENISIRESQGAETADRALKGKAAAAITALDELVQQAQEKAERARSVAEGQVARTRQVTLIVIIAVFILGLILALALSLSVTIPLRRLQVQMEALTAGESPALEGKVTGKDEVAQIESAFREMVKKATLLRGMEQRSRRLEALSARVACAQEAERERIARELHDGIGQALTAIKLDLSSAAHHVETQPETAAEAIAKAKRLVEDSLEELRALAFDLRPPALDTLGLVPAVNAYAREFERRTGIPVAVVADPIEERLPYSVETALYRICQESLTNAGKHSGAESITIRLAQTSDHISLVIKDDGQGFDMSLVLDADGSTRGLGLLGMERRAQDLGGTFRIESRPGSGTTIKVRTPRSADGQEP